MGPLSPERWRTLNAHLDELLDLPDEERAARLAELRARDPDLAADLQSLLDEHRVLNREGFLAAEPDRPAPTLAGKTLGPYTLVAPLGEGGMGEVWLAEQQEPVRRKVAVKVIKHGMDTAQVVARFEIERQALAMMNHSSVAKVFDAGSTPGGRPYFVMEYVRGVSIKEYCDRHRLTTAERLALFMRVCDGVQHAHQKAVIHRDLKPSNVMVAIEDGKPVPKIIDFGVAKAAGEGLTERTLHTALGALIGTLEYMSPEQADPGGQDIDTRTDVYSLGVILYELLVSVLPLDSRNLPAAGFEEIRRRIREEEPKRPSARLSGLGREASIAAATNRGVDPSTLCRQLRGELDWIVMKAMEKDRRRRYGSPAELAADIGRYLGKLPVLAGPPGAGYRARKFVQRHRVGVAIAVLAALGLATFAFAMALQSSRTARERDRANREAKTANRALRVLRDLFQVSDPSEARGSTVTAREILDRGAGKIDEELKDEPLVQAALLLTLGQVYRSLGLHAASQPLLEKSAALRRRLLGDRNLDTVESVDALAGLLQDQGKYVEAEGRFREALAVRRALLEHDDPDTLTSINNLGLLLHLEGKTREAEPLLREALDGERRTLGPDDPDLLMGLNNFGLLLQETGKSEEAEPYVREVLEKCRRTMGSDHPHTLSAINNAALVLQSEGKLAEAEPLWREALETRRRVLGPDHPLTLLSLYNLGSQLRMEGDLAESERDYRQAVEGLRRVLGPEHPRTLDALNGMGLTLQAEGKLKEAEAVHREVLTARRRMAGSDSEDIIQSLTNLGFVLHEQRRLGEAESLLREATESARRILGADNLTALSASVGLADLYTSAGRLPEAEKLLADILSAARRTLPAGHRLIGKALCYQGRCLTALGRTREAEAALVEARGILSRSEPGWVPRVTKYLAELQTRP